MSTEPGTAHTGALRVLAPLFLLFAACASPAENAVKEIVSFAQDAHYVYVPPTGIAISESQLPRYTKLFEYFDPTDSIRASKFADLPLQLWRSLPITKTISTTTVSTSSNTVRATVIFSRPDPELFKKEQLGIMGDSSSSKAVPDVQHRLDQFQQAMRQGLQMVDTAYIDLTIRPKVIGITTASDIRDSLRLLKVASEIKARLKRTVEAASISVGGFVAPSAQLRGALLELHVHSDRNSWPTSQKVYASFNVECTAANGTGTTSVSTDFGSTFTSAHTDTYCQWLGEDGERWLSLRPTMISVRVFAVIDADTLFGPWHQLNRSALRSR